MQAKPKREKVSAEACRTSGRNEYCSRARRREKERGGEKEWQTSALESMRMYGGRKRERAGKETRMGPAGRMGRVYVCARGTRRCSALPLLPSLDDEKDKESTA
ncbi:hypothetical protein KM043_015364 [Ampulex compressa]|nr:hypothetical protein KM043_015364 [Ampulex compressa]